MECDFCKRTFSSKSNLLNHQKTTKYCIEMQGKQPTYFECEFCNKKFTSHQNQIEHSCKERERENNIKQQKEFEHNIKNKYELKIKELEYLIINRDERIKGFESIINEKNEYIAKIEARLDKFETTVVTLASEPKTTKTTNNVVLNNNTLNLSKEHVTKVLEEHFTKEVAAGGQKRLAEMVYEKMLKGPDGKSSYVCVDPSRQTFEFTNNDGDVERDVKAKKLTKALINSDIQKKAAEVGNQIWTKADGHVDSTLYEYCSQKVMELACFERDDSKFRSELSALTS